MRRGAPQKVFVPLIVAARCAIAAGGEKERKQPSRTRVRAASQFHAWRVYAGVDLSEVGVERHAEECGAPACLTAALS